MALLADRFSNGILYCSDCRSRLICDLGWSRYIKSHLEVLGLDKMCLALEQKYGEPPLDAIMEAFSLFDADGDGYITSEELVEMLSTVDNNLEENAVANLMTKADLDGDGVISFEEFYQLIMRKPPPPLSAAVLTKEGSLSEQVTPSERQRTPPREAAIYPH